MYEAIIDDDRRSNAFGLLMSLNMLIETQGGFDYTGADCRAWMQEAGFRESRVEHLRRARLDGGRDQVVSPTIMPGADGVVRGLVDEDEAAGGAVARVGVGHERRAQAQLHAADVVERRAPRRGSGSSVWTSTRCSTRVDDRAGGAGRVLDRVARAGAQRRVGHPADVGRRARAPARARRRRGRSCRRGRASRSSSSSSVTDIGGNASSSSPSSVSIAAIRVRRPEGSTTTLVAGREHAAGHLARVAAVVGALGRVRADDPLDREARVVEVAVGGDLDVLEVVQQRRALVPRHVLGAVDDVVARAAR